MSNFSQFFLGSANAGGAGGNIFSGIKPPAFATFGNSQNFSKSASWATENFNIPNHLGYVLGINFGVKVTVATWNNTLVWSATDGVTGSSSVVNAFIYNQVLDKWYLATTVTGAGVYEVNILTGARTLITSTVPAFLSQSFPLYASLSYCTSDGLYTWRNGDTIRKYNQNFVEIQNKSYIKTDTTNDSAWYYTEDCKIRVQSITSWLGQGTANTTTVTPDAPVLLIERYGSRRIVELTAEMVFNARVSQTSTNFVPATMTPMSPSVANGAFVGNAVRLGGTTRNSAVIPDAYLLDRVDYDRWLSDVCDALGMPASDSFYGDWVNV